MEQVAFYHSHSHSVREQAVERDRKQPCGRVPTRAVARRGRRRLASGGGGGGGGGDGGGGEEHKLFSLGNSVLGFLQRHWFTLIYSWVLKIRRLGRKSREHELDRTPYKGDRKISFVARGPSP